MPRPTNALIVDDEAHVRTYMKLLLRELGITSFWEIGEGATAISMALQFRPQLILLDINLPQVGGMEVLAKVREAAPEIPVIMITSQSAINTVSEAARLGALGYLLKHCPKEDALASLSEMLDSLEESDEEEGTE